MAVYLLCIGCFGYLCLLMGIPAFFAIIPALLISRSIIARAKGAFVNARQA